MSHSSVNWKLMSMGIVAGTISLLCCQVTTIFLCVQMAFYWSYGLYKRKERKKVLNEEREEGREENKRVLFNASSYKFDKHFHQIRPAFETPLSLNFFPRFPSPNTSQQGFRTLTLDFGEDINIQFLVSVLSCSGPLRSSCFLSS